MGRLFVTELEGPVYTCKYCRAVQFAVYDPMHKIPTYFEFPASFGKLYYLSKCFNVVIGTDEITITLKGANNEIYDCSFKEVFCVACGSHLGFYCDSAFGKWRYNEGIFYITRHKLHGPT